MSSAGDVFRAFATAVAIGVVSIACPPLATPVIVATATVGTTAAVVGRKTGDEKLERFGESLMEGASLNLGP